MSNHRHTAPGTHEHEQEPQYGLPEALPVNETLLWQGSPDYKQLAVHAFHVRAICWYFIAIVFARIIIVWQDTSDLVVAVSAGAWVLGLGAFAVAGLTWLAWMTARNTVYTITDQRVVMRIGIALTLTFNLPLRAIAAAGLAVRSSGHGDIPLTLTKDAKIALLHLWPHCRPWKIANPEPMLRGIPAAANVAKIITKAWQAKNGQAYLNVQPAGQENLVNAPALSTTIAG
jgi:Bacterial PH domain